MKKTFRKESLGLKIRFPGSLQKRDKNYLNLPKIKNTGRTANSLYGFLFVKTQKLDETVLAFVNKAWLSFAHIWI